MFRYGLVGLLLIQFACQSLPQRLDVPLRTSGPLEVSSRDSDLFSTVGVFLGRYALFPDSVVVEFDSATVIRRDSGFSSHPAQLDSISVALGAPSQAKGYTWKLERQSLAVAVGRPLATAPQFKLPPMRFMIPKKPRDDLARNWIVVAFHHTALTPAGEGSSRYFSTYAHSRRDFFVPGSDADKDSTRLLHN